MSAAKKSKFYSVAIDGLRAANRGNPFWTQSDAMQLINLTRMNQKEL